MTVPESRQTEIAAPHPMATVRADGGYVGRCTSCRLWYWNSWGAGTYCGACLHGYTEALKERWDDAETRGEDLYDARERLLNVMAEALRALRVGRTEEAIECLASEGRNEGMA